MKVTYDEESDTIYMKLRETEYYKSDEITEGFILDYDSEGKVIGIEILRASTHLNSEDLSTVNFEINRKIATSRDN